MCHLCAGICVGSVCVCVWCVCLCFCVFLLCVHGLYLCASVCMPTPMCSCGGVCVQVGGYVCFLVCASTSAYVLVAVWAPGLGGGCVPGRLSRVRMGERQEERRGCRGAGPC